MKPDDPNWHSVIEAPQVIDDEAEINWDNDTDLVVVGWGAAGAATALEARERGLQVIALDRAEGGGATAMSGGVIYAGGGTSTQKEVGEEDTPQAMFDYLKLETQGVVSDATLMKFCEDGPETIDWLKSHGVRFSGPVWKKKTSYPNVKYFLYHSDNSLLPHYKAVAEPAARGHRGVIKKGRSAVNLGVSMTGPMTHSALAKGVQLHKQTEVRQLITDKTGRVIGVKALQIVADSDEYRLHGKYLSRAELIGKIYPFFLPGGGLAKKLAIKYGAKAAAIEANERHVRYYKARRGVVLSAGGFIFNRDMVEHHCKKFRPGMPLGTPADDGGGIRLGESVGGATDRMDHGTAWRFINPPLAWSQGIIVNAKGERYVNESCYGATIGDAMVEHNDGKGWLILDDKLVKEAWRQSTPGKVLPFQWQLAALNMLFGKKKFDNSDELSDKLGLDKDTFGATIEEYNRIASGELEDPFGKAPEDVPGLEAPFHVINVSLGARLLPCTVLTMGGLVLNEETGQVQRDDGSEIEGLYAAGRTAVGICSHLYMSGLSIGDCVFSGRRAGRHAAGA
jgi:3-oxo-5alpha-steroid 4-dehydrogenase